jgi:nucleotide-binding universal stress UspA family protein
MYKKILVPTDGSDTAKLAIKEAVNLAKALNSKIIGIHVIDVTSYVGVAGGVEPIVWETVQGLLNDEGTKALSMIEKSALHEKVESEVILKEGIPSEEIINVSKEKEVDLIVMGTAGRTGLDRFLLGSVAEKVIRTSSCPVMIVRK